MLHSNLSFLSMTKRSNLSWSYYMIVILYYLSMTAARGNDMPHGNALASKTTHISYICRTPFPNFISRGLIYSLTVFCFYFFWNCAWQITTCNSGMTRLLFLNTVSTASQSFRHQTIPVRHIVINISKTVITTYRCIFKKKTCLQKS